MRTFNREYDRRWLAAALSAGALVYLVYLVTHQYPAYGAGLYLKGAEQISANGYGLPTQIPHYTSNGVPFAYPPLFFYAAAVVRDLTGVSPITYSLYVPGLFVLGYLIPYYFTAKELLGSARMAGFASVLFAVTPEVLQWHLSAGGIVRGGAFLLALTGTYVGIRLFRSGDVRWLPPAAILFGLTVLSHPTYTVFFVLTYLLLFAKFAPTPRGLTLGALVAAGGFTLAAPWLVTIATTHGLDVFAAASGTHSGLGGGAARLVATAGSPTLTPGILFYVGAYAGALYALVRRRWFLFAWFVVPGFVINKVRFQFVAGSLLTAILVAEVVIPRVVRLREENDIRRQRLIELAVAGLVVVSAVGIGTAFAAGALDTRARGATQPAFMDNADQATMEWAADNTEPSAQFVVLGDAAEWFPLFTDRTILVGPWGVEWTSVEQYNDQLELYRSISDCDTASCLTRHLQAGEVDPDYVYVPKGHYTVRGFSQQQSDQMRASLVASDRYRLAYENQGVMVFSVESAAGST